jgi:hypothetical protein
MYVTKSEHRQQPLLASSKRGYAKSIHGQRWPTAESDLQRQGILGGRG